MLLPDERHGSDLLVDPVLARLPRIRHGYTTRTLGDASGEPPGGEAVTRALAGEEWQRHGLEQVHGSEVPVALGTVARGDGLVTVDPGRLLVVRTADCLPVLMAAVGPGVQGVAAVHAGWRGLVGGVLGVAVEKLRSLADARTRLVASFGPCIGACCFEIGPEVAEPLRALAPRAVTRGDRKDHADLQAAATEVLAAHGVVVANPSPAPCTRCHADLFWSHRRDGASAGRMASFIGMRA